MGQRLGDDSPTSSDRAFKVFAFLTLAALIAVVRRLLVSDTDPRSTTRSIEGREIAVSNPAVARFSAASVGEQRTRTKDCGRVAPRALDVVSAHRAAFQQAQGRASVDRRQLPVSSPRVALLDSPFEDTSREPGLLEAVTEPGFFDDLNALFVEEHADVAPSRARRFRPAPFLRAVRSDLPWLVMVATICVAALLLRLINHSSNYGLFIDEITYANIGQAIALGHGVSLYGTPFFLHPPLFFYLEATVLDLFGQSHASPVRLILDLRPINCVIGTLETGLVIALVSRWANRTAAVIAGIFVACDPFILLWDGRVLLETMAMTSAVAGWLCLDVVARRDASVPSGETARRWGQRGMIIVAGLLFGVSFLSKETYAFVGIVPLVGMLIINSPLRRRIIAGVLAIVASCYGAFLLGVGLCGHLGLWWDQNTVGFQRALGTKQITGFNQGGGHHASLGGSLSADLTQYLVSYLVIVAVGIAATVGVVRWFRAARAGRELARQRRLAIALGAGGVSYVAYAVMFGAFETQIFYMCIIGGLPVLVTELLASSWRRTRAHVHRRVLVGALVLVGCLAMACELAIDIRLRSQRDTALPELVSYVERHVPNGSLVDSTDGVSNFVLQDVRIDGLATVPALTRARPDYVEVDWGLVDEGYIGLGPGLREWLSSHAHVVFAADGSSTGRLDLYETTYATTDSGAQS